MPCLFFLLEKSRAGCDSPVFSFFLVEKAGHDVAQGHCLLCI